MFIMHRLIKLYENLEDNFSKQCFIKIKIFENCNFIKCLETEEDLYYNIYYF